jgi:hypothetical protein
MKKGEKVRVRLGTGEVAEAVYDGPSGIKKQHWVHVRGRLCRAMYYTNSTGAVPRVRFVGPPCVLVPVGVVV